MTPRAKKKPPSHKRPAGAPAPHVAATFHTFPAPVAGLDLATSQAFPPPGTARVLSNFVCTQTGIRVRAGSQKHATISATDAVESLFSYTAGSGKLFAATETDIFDVTAPGDPDIAPPAVVTGQRSGGYSTQQFTTPGGSYLYAVNGADSAQLYDGSTWQPVTGSSTPSITGVTTSGLSFVWSFGSRLWFAQGDTLSAWYLPVDSIGGAATELSLAGVFRKGGSLMFGGAWSTDAGDGLGDKCLFVSSEGEVAIYQGVNPASDWTMVGLYDIGRPVGKNATAKAGGDFLIATELGIVPMSRAVTLDVAALAINAVTRKIEPLWRSLVSDRGADNWSILRHDANGYMIVSTPDIGDDTGLCLVANMQTGAWSTFTGWDAQCMAISDGVAYFGNSDGMVFTAEAGGTDNGENYTCTYIGQFERLDVGAAHKVARNARAVLSASSPFVAHLAVLSDYDETFIATPQSPAEYTADVWDYGIWDAAVWDAAETTLISNEWRSVSGSGQVLAPAVKMVFGVTPTPNVNLVSVDMTYSVGAMVS